MSNYRRCPLCGEYGWFDSPAFGRHKCAPKWECRGAWEDWPDAEWMEVHALDASTAAEKFADKYDCEGGDYAILQNRRGDSIVYVRKPLDFEDDPIGPRLVEMFVISAEAVPVYRATPTKVTQ